MVRAVETFVPKSVVGILDKFVTDGRVGIKLMLAAMLLLPQTSFCNKKAACPADKMSKCIGG